ncbi:MAG: UvrD-helicase domain-containing protein [Actinomycetota bacterium]|nr:UvrD-helicase domain-containing protein [Actinomycetota bacterium]
MPLTFDLTGPLPVGTTVLEASAGTGKTHTIAALAARYVAEGVARVDELMLVTFGRAATVELRERVRESLVRTRAALVDPAQARASKDEVARHLATGSDAVVGVRRLRLAKAVANFDAATIATTHGFSHQMLAGLGIAADVDRDVTFAESSADLVTEVVTDLYVRAYGQLASAAPAFDFKTAAKVANGALADRQARLEPSAATRDSVADLRQRLATSARDQVALRKRARRVMDYDDLLVHLRDALTDPATGGDARDRIRGRYKVVLVDEFQDTDPVQWEILEAAFHGHRTMVLIGDPKQAIYAFRGADVVTYLLATEAAEATSTLGTNWRSDEPLVDALQHVMVNVALGDERIVVHPVDAANPAPRLTGAPSPAPLRLRVLNREVLRPGRGDLLAVKDVRPYIAADVASDIVALLSSGAAIDMHTDTEVGERPLRPADIAVLVQRNDDGATMRDALRALRVPVVLTGTSSVFLSDAANDWLALLSALEQPHRPGLARGAALTSFVGWDAQQLAADDDAVFDELSVRLHEWARVLSTRGVAALLEVVVAGHGLVERVLAVENGERHVTDLRHIGHALHAEATSQQSGVASLVEWLQRRMSDAAADTTEERSRRLDSDAAAVQIITVHRSKGLEFPVVYAPFLWDKWADSKPDPMRLHDPDGVRILDVGGPDGDGYAARRSVWAREEAGESLRLAYVALTRARSQVVTYWAPTSNTATAPLHRFLFGDRSVHGGLSDSCGVGSDDFVRRRLADLATSSAGAISVEEALGGSAAVWQPPSPAYVDLAFRDFDRSLDLWWTRTSYSGLTAGLHDAAHAGEVTSETEEPGVLDEPASGVETRSSGQPSDQQGVPSPMADLPAGAAFGTLVHQVLETVDFTAPDLRVHLVELCQEAASERFTGVPAADFADALLPSLATPLGPLAGGRRLMDIPTRDRLNELDFELPLLGGDTPSGDARVGQIAAILDAHLPADDPLHAYARDLAGPLLATRRLRGFLAGSIDVVLRVPADDGQPRYLVVDYKTNWLGAGETLTSRHYRPEAMARAMRDAHYPLQALLYAVALHRFLRWRQAGYDPSVHLGGVLYLFLRGMCGPSTPVVDGVPTGVFSWSPPTSLVVELSNFLDRGAL